MYSRLQYISTGNTVNEQLNNIRKVLENKGNWIQLRWKNAPKTALIELAFQVTELKKQFDFTYIINDHVSIAYKVNSDGVHLGLKDLSVQQARNLLGSDKIIGGTANTAEDVRQRIAENCDYIGLGPLRFTSSKQNLSPVLGYEGYQNIIQEIQKEDQHHPPIYAIGGIKQEDILQLQHIGIYGVAVSSLLTHSVSTQSIIQHINHEFYG